MTREEGLVAAAKAGDRNALEELLAIHIDDLYRFSLQLMWSDKAGAEDLCQESLLSAIEGLPTFRGTSTFRTWLFGVAYNKYRHYLSRKDAIRKGATTMAALPVVAQSSEVLVVAKQEQEVLDKALATIAPGQREALYLRDILGCTYREAATVLGISVSSVKNRVHHGRKSVTSAVKAMTGIVPKELVNK